MKKRMVILQLHKTLHRIRRLKIKAKQNEKRIMREKDKLNRLYGASVILTARTVYEDTDSVKET